MEGSRISKGGKTIPTKTINVVKSPTKLFAILACWIELLVLSNSPPESYVTCPKHWDVTNALLAQSFLVQIVISNFTIH